MTNNTSTLTGNSSTQSFSSATASGSGNLSASSSGTPGSNVTLTIPGQNTVSGGGGGTVGAVVTTAATPGGSLGTTTSTGGAAATSADQALLDAVISALSSDPSLSGATIQVVVDHGRVKLNGNAVTAEQATRAKALAANVAGPDRVSSTITAKG